MICMYACMYACSVCMYVYITWVHVCMYVCIYACMYVYMYACMHPNDKSCACIWTIQGGNMNSCSSMTHISLWNHLNSKRIFQESWMQRRPPWLPAVSWHANTCHMFAQDYFMNMCGMHAQQTDVEFITSVEETAWKLLRTSMRHEYVNIYRECQAISKMVCLCELRQTV